MAGVLANMIRVFVVVYLGYKTDMQHPYVNDHLMLGWYLFGVLVILLLFIDAFLHRYFRRRGSAVKSDENIAQDSISKSVSCAKGVLHQAVIMLVSALMLIAGPAAAYIVNNQASKSNEQLEIAIPESVADWNQVDISDDWMPVYRGAANRKQVYMKSADKIILYTGCYVSQQQGEELINELNRISNEAVWKTAYPRARLRNTGRHAALEQLLETNTGERRLVWYWYRVAERTTTSDYEAKLLQLLGLMTGNNQACVIAISTDHGEDPDIARNRLAEFAVETGLVEQGLYD
jgi:EpsI family protein